MRYILFFSLLLGSMPAQRPGQEQDILNAAVATFDGTLRALDKKQLVLELVGEQSLTILVNRKTKFMRGTKTMAAKDVRVGALVIVEAKKVMSELVAVRVLVKDVLAQRSLPAHDSLRWLRIVPQYEQWQANGE